MLCKQFTNAHRIQILLFGIFWNFFPKHFYSLLVESIGTKPVDMEGQLY